MGSGLLALLTLLMSLASGVCIFPAAAGARNVADARAVAGARAVRGLCCC